MITTYVTKDEIQARREALKRKLAAIALKKGIVTSPDELAIRDILPATDLGFSAEKWATATLPSGAYTAVVDMRLPANKLVGFYGVQDLTSSPVTSVIRFKIGPGKARVLDVWQIEATQTEKEKIGISENDVIYENQEYATVEYYNFTTGVSNVVLLGIVAEPKGEVVAQG